MAVSGLDAGRLTAAIVDRMKSELGAKERDETGEETALRRVAAIIAEEVVRELREAKVTVYLPADSVVVEVTGNGQGTTVRGVRNAKPIAVNNSQNGGLS